MKRILLLVAMVATLTCSLSAQLVSCTGNFTGNGTETLRFIPIGYSARDYMQEGIPDVYQISGEYAPSFLYKGFYLTPAGVCDVDGDGMDELAFISMGMNGCWGSLIVLDYYQGEWHYLTTKGISVYTCDDDDLSNLISPTVDKKIFYARTWRMVLTDIRSYKQKYPINRSRYYKNLKGYYNLKGKFISFQKKM